MDWCIKDFAEANHPPVPHLTHPETLTVKSGTSAQLDATGSTDPDGDLLNYHWIHYREPGTYKDEIELEKDKMQQLNFIAPEVDYPQTAHFILKVTDSSEPALTRYERVIVNLMP